MAKALGFLGRATKAIETYHRAISILESSKGEENEELVVPLYALGNLLLKERRTADAETAFGRLYLFLHSFWSCLVMCYLFFVILNYLLPFVLA